MSRSFKKEPYYSCIPGSFKSWKQAENTTYRAKCKQALIKCDNWDEFLLPKPKRNIFWSPKDCCWMGRRQKKPLINECEIDAQESKTDGWIWEIDHFKLNEAGHHKYCECYTNKRSSYWKMMRK